MNPHPAITTILDRLAALGGGDDAAICFDADGTLWSGDVGEDFFRFALQRGLLLEAALPSLQAMARRFGIPEANEANAQAELLLGAYARGLLPEPETCEVMATGFAGYSEDALYGHVRECLDAADFAARRFRPLEQVINWADRSDTAVFVISASPDFVVHVAAQAFGVTKERIAGCAPSRAEGILAGTLQTRLPYGPGKVVAGQKLLGSRRWLASFGDSDFDRPMLEAAALGVAVRPKASLRRLLNDLPGILLLDQTPA